MMRLLDTNILSETVRPRPNPQVMARLFAHTHGTLFASEITRYELRRGACLRPDAEDFWSRLEALALPVAEWLPVTQPISLRAAELAADLQRQGREIGTPDTFSCRHRHDAGVCPRDPQRAPFRARGGLSSGKLVCRGLTPCPMPSR